MVSHSFAATTSSSRLKAIALACLLAVACMSECMADAQAQVNTVEPNVSLAQSGQLPNAPIPEGLPPMGDMDCQKYDQYNTRIMSTIYLPSVCDTVSPKLFGFRDFLADHGWGIQASTSPVVDYDIVHGKSSGTQYYAGQKASAYDISNVYLTYDLTRIGLAMSE